MALCKYSRRTCSNVRSSSLYCILFSFIAKFMTCRTQVFTYNMLYVNAWVLQAMNSYRNRNCKLLISKAPTKAKSQEPTYSHALNQNKIDRQRSRSRESCRQADSQTAMVDGVWN